MMLYCFLLVKPFGRAGTRASGVFFFIWLILGFICSIANIAITATTKCVDKTQWGHISKFGCIFIIILTVGTVIAAFVMLFKWTRVAASAAAPGNS